MIRRNGRERIENILRKQIVFKREGVLKRRKMADSGDEPSSSHDSPPSNDGENSPSPPPPTPTTPPPASEDKPSNSPPPSSSSPPPSQKSSPPPSPSESSPPHSNTPPPSASPSPSPSPPPPVSPPPSSPPPSNSPPSGSESSKAPPPSKSDSSPPPPSNSDSSPPPPQKSSPEPPPESPPPSPPPPTPPPQPSPPPPPSPTPPSGSPPPGKSTPPPPPPPPVTPPPAPASSNNTTLPVPGGSVPLPPPRARLPTPPPPPVAIDSPEESSHDVPGVLSPPSTSSRSNTNTTSSDSSGSSGTSTTIIGVSVAGVIFISLVALVFLFLRRRKKKQDEVFAAQYRPPNSFSLKSGSSQNPQSPNGIGNVYQPGGPDSGLGSTKSWFSYEELMEITNGFSRENILGEGGFGCVYKGWLPDGRIVAVKQLKAGSGQGEREFRAEVEIISRVHHRHLVSLVGFCIAEHHRLLIYEFVPNKTLEHHLHGNGLPVLDWTKRIKIALGSARGLAYLHEDCHPKIIHRDIKSANILLDDAFEAQVADFGLAKLANDTNTHVSTRVMGTFGYMAPEYASSGKLTDRSDVFSFGVVLLELVTGRKPVDASQPLGDESLVEWARPLLLRALETGDFSEVVDPRLEKKYVESEMFRMIEAAAACVRHSAPKRPRMVQVVRALDSEGEMSDLSNGVKYGQSTVYESGQYNHDISRFRRMAFGSGESSNFDMFSGEYDSREYGPPSSSEFPSSGSETQAINAHSGEHRSERRF